MIKWLYRVLWTLGFAVLYYLLFSWLFDTPIEHTMTQNTRHLERQYKLLTSRMDTLNRVLANLQERDRAVYNLIFNADPLELRQQERRTKRSIDINNMSNGELGREFYGALSSITQRVIAMGNLMASQKVSIFRSRGKVNMIPSIQPVENNSLELISASFGRKVHPFYKTMHQHNGVDFSVASGTAVFATADGRVEQINISGGKSTGISVYINHGDGYRTIYSNLDKVLRMPGAIVARGDVIALSGNSGISFAPHLHYQVELWGKPVDPLPYFFLELSPIKMERLKGIASVAMQSFD